MYTRLRLYATLVLVCLLAPSIAAEETAPLKLRGEDQTVHLHSKRGAAPVVLTSGERVTVTPLAGGHHMGGAYDKLGKLILDRLAPAAGAGSPTP